MKLRIVTVIILAITIAVNVSCQKETASEPTPLPVAIIPGDIAFTFMPADGSHMFKIYTVNSDGNENTLLMSANGVGLNMPNWSADGKKIATWGWLNQSTISIYSFNSDGSGLSRLTTSANVYDMFPHWSPDGTRITFTRQYPSENYRTDIWIMNSDGSNPKFIMEGYQSKWSPDGNKLIYVSNKTGNYEIYTINTDGSNQQKITSTQKNEQGPEFSANGSKILYSAYNTGEYNTFEIYVMNSDGTNDIELTNNNAIDTAPRWSPDGLRIVYDSELSAERHTEIYIMNADGSGQKRLTFSSGNSTSAFPSWKPKNN
ncbi:MAG: DUF5050 domain-containing protein [Melioribacteraceae bacterium]